MPGKGLRGSRFMLSEGRRRKLFLVCGAVAALVLVWACSERESGQMESPAGADAHSFAVSEFPAETEEAAMVEG